MQKVIGKEIYEKFTSEEIIKIKQRCFETMRKLFIQLTDEEIWHFINLEG